MTSRRSQGAPEGLPAAAHVVIATRDRRAILERTLAALAAQTRGDFRVVVVDDGSTDGSWEWLVEAARRRAGPQLVVRRQAHRGQGQARNLGLEEVAEGLVIFLGDDVLPAPGFVAAHLAAHADGGDRAVVGFTDWRRSEMRVTPLLEMVNREGHQFGYGHLTAGGEAPFTCFYTSNVSLPRRLLDDRPFDPAFRAYGWEDVELGYRLWRRGVRLVYHPEAAAEHLHPTDLTAFFARQRRVGASFGTLVALHPELAGDPRLAPLEPPRWFALGRRLLPPLVPWLDALDRRRVPLPRRLLHAVLMCGFYLGRQAGGQGERGGA